jgi:hypothetical protein
VSNKSLSKLTRNELLDLLYEQEKRVEDLEKRNKQLEAQLEDRRIKISKVGSIADASLALTNVFAEAQKAVDLYLANVQGIVKEKKTSQYEFPNNEKNAYQPRRGVGSKKPEKTKEEIKAAYVSRHGRKGGAGK